METLTGATSQVDIISRALDDAAQGFPPEAARFFLALRLAHKDAQRMDELAEKARQGALTPAEEMEIEEYRRCVRFMDIIKLKARLALHQVP
jgi:uncharacterized protein YnzC (UPF0291/DUF896 family)